MRGALGAVLLTLYGRSNNRATSCDTSIILVSHTAAKVRATQVPEVDGVDVMYALMRRESLLVQRWGVFSKDGM